MEVEGNTIIRRRYISGTVENTITYVSENELISRGYYSDGTIMIEYWYKNDLPSLLHNAGILSKTDIELYYRVNELHRLDGPAIRTYNKDGTIEFEEFFINGKRIFDPLEFYCEAGEYANSK